MTLRPRPTRDTRNMAALAAWKPIADTGKAFLIDPDRDAEFVRRVVEEGRRLGLHRRAA